MADAVDPPAAHQPPPSSKVLFQPMADRLVELDASQSDLSAKIEGLKKEVQNWKLVIDTQVKRVAEELSELKTALNVELNQLNSEVKELKTTFQEEQKYDNIALENLKVRIHSFFNEFLHEYNGVRILGRLKKQLPCLDEKLKC